MVLWTLGDRLFERCFWLNLALGATFSQILGLNKRSSIAERPTSTAAHQHEAAQFRNQAPTAVYPAEMSTPNDTRTSRAFAPAQLVVVLL
jgi:hypothetical protein